MRIVSKIAKPAFGLFLSLALLVPGAAVFAQTTQTPDQPSTPAVTAEQVQSPAETAGQTQVPTEASNVAEALPQASGPSFEILFADASERDKEVLGKAEKLASEGKWKSAWTVLSEADPENGNPFLLAEKIRIALDGYAQTTMHLVYGFVDLAEGENLEMLRFGAPDTGDPVDFNPAQITDSLEERGEAIPPVLSLKLGEFYHTVWQNYQGQWLLPDEELLVKGVENYDRALAYDLYSLTSLDQQSGMLIALQRYDGAEKILAKALGLSPDNNTLILRLAEVYYSVGRTEEVYPLADKVIASAADDNELNDGYIIAIRAGLSALDEGKLAKYIDGLEASFPGDYTPGLVRHLVAVQLGNSEAADAAADKVTETFLGNPDVVRSLLSTWLSANDPDSGFRYLERAIAKGGADDAMASFYFYRAMLKGEVAASPEDLQQAILDLETAKGYFINSYPEGHEIFSLLEEIKAEWEAALNPPAPEAAATSGAEGPAAPEATAADPASAEAAQSYEADAGSAATEAGAEETP
jgi:tetratricopeptide (TPR) repeat protein